MITMASYLEDYKNGVGAAIALNNFLSNNPKHSLALAIKEIKDTTAKIATKIKIITTTTNAQVGTPGFLAGVPVFVEVEDVEDCEE